MDLEDGTLRYGPADNQPNCSPEPVGTRIKISTASRRFDLLAKLFLFGDYLAETDLVRLGDVPQTGLRVSRQYSDV